MLKLSDFELAIKPTRQLTADEIEQAKVDKDKLIEAAVCAYAREHKDIGNNPYLEQLKRGKP